MFEFLKSTFKKFEGQKKSEEKSGAEDTQSSSQDELLEARDIFVDPVIKKLKEAKVNATAHFQFHDYFRFKFTRNIFILCLFGVFFPRQNVLDLYHVAEKIIGNNIENILDKSKSECDEPAS